MGAMVPKRWAKRAVTRNTIKRQIYSVSSEQAISVPAAAHVVRLRAGFDRKRICQCQFSSAQEIGAPGIDCSCSPASTGGQSAVARAVGRNDQSDA
jgi:hypothetical protein